MAVASPFRISLEDEELLEHSHAFTAVREHLRRQDLGMNAPRYVASVPLQFLNYSNRSPIVSALSIAIPAHPANNSPSGFIVT